MNPLHALGKLLQRAGNTIHNDVVQPYVRDISTPIHNAEVAAIRQVNPFDNGATAFHPSDQQATQILLKSGYKYAGLPGGDQQLAKFDHYTPPAPSTVPTPYTRPIGIRAVPQASGTQLQGIPVGNNSYYPYPGLPVHIPLAPPQLQGTFGLPHVPFSFNDVQPQSEDSTAIQLAAPASYGWQNIYRPQPTQIHIRPFSLPKLGAII